MRPPQLELPALALTGGGAIVALPSAPRFTLLALLMKLLAAKFVRSEIETWAAPIKASGVVLE